MTSRPAPITRLPDSAGGSGRARWWAVAIVAVVLLGVGIAAQLMSRQPSTIPGHPDNSRGNGAMAVTRILAAHGVDVRVSVRTDATLEQASETIAIVDPGRLTPEQFERITGLGTDLVLLDAGGLAEDPSAATSGLVRAGHAAAGTVAADCSDPDAVAAGSIAAGGPVFTGPDGAMECFPVANAGGALMVRWQQDGRSITVIPREVALNRSLAEAGNAALALRVLGTGSELTWMVASTDDPTGESAAPADPLTLLWTAAGILALALAWWQIPRFGRLAVEPLPVTVPASETVSGRGALYRRHRDVPHAARALRAGATGRMADRIGLAPGAGRAEVAGRIGALTGRPPAAIAAVLYGPPPTDAAGLSTLAHALDILESEVHHR
ncbi:DUF4350 domain-containing protein [Pseudactinotalea sp. HY158]|uniref:DUF4350 domain-containing protein n=1 Tax=Pseudactinotalea sp. HY158 TaxID=2654547 RepID=UPI00129C4C6F|nr:DUF4350 domain-containing protein [Pseudactinotalea sp. HY158]QGH68850.1 DUF4350 domain-containing protein [Pseudactinotalea sp. HY158]